MTFNYTQSQATADKLIKNFGRAISLKRIAKTGSAYDPTQAESLTDLQAAVVDYSRFNMNETLIERGDKLVYVSAKANDAEPLKEDILVIDGEDFAIININALKPAGIVVYYEIQARKI
jgi:hypothetical protein